MARLRERLTLRRNRRRWLVTLASGLHVTLASGLHVTLASGLPVMLASGLHARQASRLPWGPSPGRMPNTVHLSIRCSGQVMHGVSANGWFR